IILLDPPTFSNSKRMDSVLDVQRDQVDLISKAMKLLDQHGVLYFSNNLRDFRMEIESLSEFQLTDIPSSTIDEDFNRNKKIHHCWEIRHGQ
ncbi:23S rRNA (guanine(2445)-N(2))/(guanine(2069)-N(7))-methyltransferase, partial [Gilvimarinus sp. 1_MG-2023]|nr:23S rRNA (guanine(2445)-N(2))/(guanine(2069)-N(7))-methyltransferase [Gilvimarinus sp. 1_MG-2023]